MERFVILKDEAAPPRAATRSPVFGARAGAPEATSKPSIEARDLSKKDLREVARDPKVNAVARVMPTKLIKPLAATADSGAGEAWGVSAVGADESSLTGDGVVVAVLDTGIESDHPAFAGLKITQQDFTGTGDGDTDGHGTHCAGTIFGRDVGAVRIGIARGVRRALIGKVLDPSGGGTSEMILRAVNWAVDRGAHVVSMSLGIDFPGHVKQLIEERDWPPELATSRALEDYRSNVRMFDSLTRMAEARGAASGEGTVIVVAAGNESKRDRNPPLEIAASLPAAALDVVSVGALDRRPDGNLAIANFSNTFPQVSAPGVDILSAGLGGGLLGLSGTSMACPHVAGVACLWWEELKGAGDVPATASTVRTKLFATARTNAFEPGVEFVDRGWGIVTAPR